MVNLDSRSAKQKEAFQCYQKNSVIHHGLQDRGSAFIERA